MMGHEHNGESGMMGSMMQHCLDMMNLVMGSGGSEATGMSSMGFNLSLSLVVALVMVGVLGYLLGRVRARA